MEQLELLTKPDVNMDLQDKEMTERFLEFVRDTRMSDINFSKEIGISKQTMSNIRNFREPVKGSQIILTARRFKKLDMNWIIRGTGKMYLKDNPPKDMLTAELSLYRMRLEFANEIIESQKAEIEKLQKC